MNKYEKKQEARRQRLLERSAKARGESSAAYDASKRIGDAIPMGQPILVGHHSEKRHRRDVDRMARKMDQSVEALKKAERLAERAASVGKGGISSDDPDAIDKLQAKLEQLEERRAYAKKVNAALRKAVKAAEKAGGEVDIAAIIVALDASDSIKKALAHNVRCFGPRWAKIDLTNIGAEIRRLKKRIAELETAAARPESEDIEGDGFRIEEDKDDNRVRFYFDERPSKEVCRKMKAAGFRWARSVGAWQRQLNNAGVYAAKRMASELFGWEE